MSYLINDVENKEDLFTLIISELRGQGIKHRKEKRPKNHTEKTGRRKIFNVPLHQLELDDVMLANGGCVQIPKFVLEATQRILDNVEMEGIFRKAGSSTRQKEIKNSLESGHQLGRDHHVVDVANVLKTFIRDLPEALLPHSLQDALLRCLLCNESTKYALMITVLLLPPLTLNTLAYLMQFLLAVSKKSQANKMTIENLAIILTPNIMPITEMVQQRLNSHVRVVQLLIENANEIGVIPERLFEKFSDNGKQQQQQSITLTDKKKKKRRSGSLTRMFNGFRKIVGAIGSSESLDKTTENISDSIQSTPSLNKSAKKRKVTDNISFSSKKKKDILSLLPDSKNGLLPNTPVVHKETKKSRLSLGGRKHAKNSRNSLLSAAPSVASIPPMERRWSVVGAPWNRKKHHQNDSEMPKFLSPVVSLSRLDNSDCEITDEFSFGISDDNLAKKDDGDDFVKIPKSEYEAIKERVSAIETRISHEFHNVQSSLLESTADSTTKSNEVDGPQSVHNKYVKALEETESIGSTASTDQLAKRLSRELKIRRSAEHKIIRSPSARKIGTMRRRSRENVRLSRNQSWHLSSTVTTNITCTNVINSNIESLDLSFYPKSNLKRGRPNTIQTGLRHPSPGKKGAEDDTMQTEQTEHWTSADAYFGNADNDQHDMSIDENINSCNIDTHTPQVNKKRNSDIFTTPPSGAHAVRRSSLRSTPRATTPRFVTNVQIGEIKTPMLPPRLPPKRTPGKTPLTALSAPNSAVVAPMPRKTLLTPLQDQQTGRASIARLRSQNAGMVMAKAKLFDGLGNEKGGPVAAAAIGLGAGNKLMISRAQQQQHGLPKSHISRIKESSPRKSTPRKKQHNNSSKSPGGVNKRHKLKMARLQRNGDGRLVAVNENRKLIDNLKSNLQVNDKSELRVLLQDCLSPVKRPPTTSHAFLDNFNNRTPKIKGTLLLNSPRRIKTPNALSNAHFTANNSKTPLKAISAHRQSPRLVAQKNHQRANQPY